jgi:hypothetical protein
MLQLRLTSARAKHLGTAIRRNSAVRLEPCYQRTAHSREHLHSIICTQHHLHVLTCRY